MPEMREIGHSDHGCQLKQPRTIPYGTLIADANGDLFGTTSTGGASNDGTVFELVKSGSTYTLNTLVSFRGSDGAAPT